MAVRVTSAEVSEIMNDLSDSLPADLTPFITAANLLVDRIQNEADDPPNSSTLKEIERWLAAHFICMDIRQPVRREIEGAVEVYPKLGEGLKMTTYGQMALSLDTTGLLATFGSSSSFDIEAVPDYPANDDYDGIAT